MCTYKFLIYINGSCECFKHALRSACGSRMHDQMHSLHQTKKHHMHENVYPLLHWPNALLRTCMFTRRTRQSTALSVAEAHARKSLTETGKG